jgi:4-hydroxythreonine-4-phosphate dehydrogenase
LNRPRIAITLGDPAGIGPEIVAKALRSPLVRRACDPMVLGESGGVPMGKPSRRAGQAAVAALKEGLALLQSGQARALVTAPVSKESFRLAHFGFPGHTEWFAGACRAPEVAMLMASGPLRVILLTRHIPLKAVHRRLTAKVIRSSARLGYDFVKHRLGKPLPRLVLCGLNPHAGDNGIIGREEISVFGPALGALRKEGIAVAGPLPADSVFPVMAKGQFDLALAAYHDQGMIPLKVYDADRIVNITLGLPFIRASPGHGTAYDIAGRGKARPGPMIEAILLAARYTQ